MKRTYTLKPTNGNGCTWYCDSIHGNYVTAYSADGFETLIDIRNYTIYR